MFSTIFSLWNNIFTPGNQLRVKQYSSTLLSFVTKLQNSFMYCGQSKHKVFTAQHLHSRMPIKHPNDGVFISMVNCFSPTHLKYFTIQLILVVFNPILREVYWELAAAQYPGSPVQVLLCIGPTCLIRPVKFIECSKQDSKFDWKKYHSVHAILI